MHQAYEEARAEAGCPLCAGAAMKGRSTTDVGWSYICAVCGIFRITHEFLEALPAKDSSQGKLLYKVSYQFRLASQSISRPADLPMHKSAELPSLMNYPDPSVQTKTAMLLTLLGSESTYPGDKVAFDNSTDYPLISAQNSDEALFFVKSLVSQGLFNLDEYETEAQSRSIGELTTNGWLQLEKVKNLGTESVDCFIAMWFHPDRSIYDQAISSAITSTGYNPIRIDRVEHINRIDDEIIARIRNSKFLIADFTGQRNGVYFEAGFMLGLGRPVIWLCEKSELSNVHFDTRQYNTIDYVDSVDLEHRLKFRIEAIIGKAL